MARFIVVPKPGHNGRQVLWEVVDTEPKGGTDQRHAERARVGLYADEDFARGLAATLDGAGSVLDAEVRKRDEGNPF